MADGGLMFFDGNLGTFARGICLIRSMAPLVAANVIPLCREGATIDGALARIQTSPPPGTAQDRKWWQDSTHWIRQHVARLGFGGATYVRVPFLEVDQWAEVAARALAEGGRGGGAGTNLAEQYPPLPTLKEPCDEDEPDDGCEPWGGGEGSGCCGNMCEPYGGCAWHKKGPCLFDGEPVRRIDLRRACAQLGRANCEPSSGSISRCQIDEIRRESEQWAISGSTLLGTVVLVPADNAHKIPAGQVMYAIELDPIEVSSIVCLRNITVTVTTNTGSTVVEPLRIGLEPTKLFCDCNGAYVVAYDWIKYEDPDYIRITDGRCACAKLCVCVPWGRRVRIVFLLNATDVPLGAVVSVAAKGKRTCFGVMCGDCPPSALCGRTPEPPHVCVTVTTVEGLLGGMETNKLAPADVMAGLLTRYPALEKQLAQVLLSQMGPAPSAGLAPKS